MYRYSWSGMAMSDNPTASPPFCIQTNKQTAASTITTAVATMCVMYNTATQDNVTHSAKVKIDRSTVPDCSWNYIHPSATQNLELPRRVTFELDLWLRDIYTDLSIHTKWLFKTRWRTSSVVFTRFVTKVRKEGITLGTEWYIHQAWRGPEQGQQ